MRRTTLRLRTTVGVTVLCVGVLGLAGLTTYLGARAALRRSLDNALLSIARAEIASAIDEPGGRVHVHDEPPGSIRLPSNTGYEKFAQIENPADRVVARTRNLEAIPLQGDPPHEARARAGVASFGDLRYEGQTLRVLYYPLRDARGHPLIALCAVSTRNLDDSLASLRTVLALMLVVSGGVAALGASGLASRLTAPLEQIAREARAIDGASPGARLSAPGEDAELHDLAEVLNAMLARLDATVATQRRLVDAQRRFLADASHELRSPIANLRGTIEVTLRRPRELGEYRETLGASMVEIERLSRLVNDLLTLSRAETGAFGLRLTECDLAGIARDAAKAHRARAEDAGLRLEADEEASLPVRGDPHRLRQILDNLLDNALRYAPADSRVRLVAERTDGRARITVRDEGPGLSEEEQARIFDRFYRVDPSRVRATGGLGLGLAIAKAFADAHEGTLTVRSAPGEGAAFTLDLPLAPAEEA